MDSILFAPNYMDDKTWPGDSVENAEDTSYTKVSPLRLRTVIEFVHADAIPVILLATCIASTPRRHRVRRLDSNKWIPPREKSHGMRQVSASYSNRCGNIFLARSELTERHSVFTSRGTNCVGNKISLFVL